MPRAGLEEASAQAWARWVRAGKLAAALILIACVAAFAVRSWHWPLVGDAPLFHSIVFLMQHGMAPYVDIKDPNLPGTYAVQAAVMGSLGAGALAWRVWDLLLLAAIAGCMLYLCWPRSRFAGVSAGSLLALIHGRDGLIQLGQRDLLLSALVLGGYVCAFQNLRRDGGPRLLLSAGMGLLVGMASSVKPHALLLLPLLLTPIVLEVRGRLELPGRSEWRHELAALCGAALPSAACLLFLARWHAVGAFVDVLEHLVPLHAGMLRLPLGRLVAGSVSSVLLPIFLLWLPVLWRRGGWRERERGALMAGLIFGVFSYCVQGRGYPYQRYPFEVFLLLVVGLDFDWALKSGRRYLVACGAAGLAFGLLVVAPRSLLELSRFSWQSDEFHAMLSEDLQNLPENLQRQVQCFDMAGGCLATLYQQGLVQSTGYLYDCYAFIPGLPAELRADQEAYRRGFARALDRSRPRYLVVTSDECGIGPPDFAYRKLAYWPGLETLIEREYAVVVERRPSRPEDWQGHPVLPYGYRIYRRVGGE